MTRLFVVAAVVAAVLPIASAGAFTRGDLFVADHGSILELTSTGALVQSYTDPSVAQLFDLAFDNARTELYATDAIQHDVKVFDTSGALVRSFGAANLAQPRGIAVAPDGDVWVADTGGNKVDVFDAGGAHLRALGPVDVPLNLAFSPDASRLYVTQSEYGAGVRVFDTSTGADLGVLGDTASAVVLTNGIAVAGDGKVYVGDGAFGGGTDTVKAFTPTGAFAGTLAGGFDAPVDLTFDGAGNVWLTNTNNFGGDRIEGFTPGGGLAASFGGDFFTQPTGLTFLLPPTIPAPAANAGPDTTVECGNTVTLDGSGSTGRHLTYAWRAADGRLVGTTPAVTLSLPLGSSTLTLVVTDDLGRSAQDTVSVVVADTTAPTLSVSVSKPTLWAPDHQLVTETAMVAASDRCDPTPLVTLVSITSSEADNGLGDGDAAGDIRGAAIGTDDRTFSLRAERDGRGPGRTYQIVYRATDASGNTASALATVTVPRSG